MNTDLRLARIDEDGWELESGEGRHARHPETFWIPSREERETLRVGHAAKLLFRIESVGTDGTIDRGVERMWVIVARRTQGAYVGVLDSEPKGIESSSRLAPGIELLFLPEHIVDIDEPPLDYVLRKYGARLDLS